MLKGIKLIFTLIVLAQATSTFAQGELFGGAGLNKYNEKDYNGHMSTLSINIGLKYWILFNDSRFSINPGISFGNFGTKFEPTGFGFDEFTTTLWYVSVPVDFVYRIKPLGNSFFVSAGGYYGYLISALGGEGVFPEDGSLGINDGDYTYKTGDYGINFGVGYVFEKGMTLRVVYTKGLANILNYPIGSDGYIKNSNISLSIGYVLFKKRI